MVTSTITSNCNSYATVINYCCTSFSFLEHDSIDSNPKCKMEDVKMSLSADSNKEKIYSKRGNPFKRGKTWTFIYYVEDYKTGKKQQKSKGGFKTKKDAEIALKEMEARIALNQYIPESSLTLEEYLEHWFEQHKTTLQAGTINGYKVNIKNHINPALGHIRLNRLAREDINRLYFEMQNKKNLSPTTIKYVHNVLKKALNDAVIDKIISSNPSIAAKVPKKQKYKAVILNQEQMRILLKRSIGSSIELEVLLAITLGLRRGEVLGLRFSDFDLDNKEVKICQQVTVAKEKTNDVHNEDLWGIKGLKTEESNRVLSIPESVVDAIRNRKRIVDINKCKYGSNYVDLDLVCCKENGMYLSPQTVYHRFKTLLKKSNLPDIRFHDLRHSFATLLLNLDVPLKVISEILGHANIGVTGDTYLEVISEKQRQVADLVQNNLLKN